MALAAFDATFASWLTLLALLAGPGVVAAVAWCPVLASGRLRSLFRRLPPTDSTAVGYALAALGLSVPWLAAAGWAFGEIGSQAEPQGEVFLNAATLLAAVYVVCLPLVAGLGLPRLGVD